MPLCKETGERAEICLNALGVLNRLNLSQVQETYINFMSEHLVAWLKEHKDLLEREEEFFKYMKIISPKEAEFLEGKYYSMNRKDREEFFEDIIKDGIYVHQAPFFGNPAMEEFKKIFVEMPELCSEYHFEGIERPMVMGELYFIRLKHESSNKSSVRSTSMTNVKNLPAKNTLRKERRNLISTTPIRLGEMETTNLMVSKRPDLVEKLLKYYSTSEDDREYLIDHLLTVHDPFNLDLPQPKTKSINRQILDKYLNILDLELEDTIDTE